MSEDSWSDSDNDHVEDIETSVLLGLPDGEITSASDLMDPAVSRLGGVPTFHSHAAPPASDISHCRNCSNPMELLVQMWSPFEESAMDRVLYVWGCGRVRCQHKDGSIRAFRSLKLNEAYELELKAKQGKAQEKERLAKEKATQPKTSAPNPFSISSAQPFGTFASQPFGQGSLFKAALVASSEEAPTAKTDTVESPLQPHEEPTQKDEERKASTPEDELNDISQALQKASLSESVVLSSWSSSPSYTPVYLSTSSEFIAPEVKPAGPKAGDVPSAKDASSGAWDAENYERTTADPVFERFIRRVDNDAQQCVRYELAGTPLPYHTDAIYERLFPHPPPNQAPTAPKATGERMYDPRSIPPCPICSQPRVFECQLMPNAINALKSGNEPKLSAVPDDAERRKALAKILAKQPSGGASDEKTGMEWGTCMVFSCRDDCRIEDGTTRKKLVECWREEFVLVQWE